MDQHKNASVFATTHWSVVLAAGNGSESEDAFRALSDLCQNYWYPLYTFARGQGHGSQAACDLTQAFFANLLQKKTINRADPKKGRFRYFLLAALRNFICDEYDRSAALKRGGGQTLISFDAQEAED